jgi:hypothetical protein
MAIKSISDLLIEANTIKDAIIPGENTATRVGGTLVDMIDSQFQAMPPKPEIDINNHAVNPLSVYFLENGFSFDTGNPEIFLFRWKGKTRVPAGIYRMKTAGWKHPATVDSAIKWQGWKFFNGAQTLYGAATTNTRVTEWAVPSTIKPYERYNLSTFNKYMFFEEIDTSVPSINAFDVNVLVNSDYKLNDKVSAANPNYKFKISGSAKRLNQANGVGFQKVVSYRLALAVDNPYATQTNGLCPKIFGPMSDEFHVIWNKSIALNSDNVWLTFGNHNRLSRVVRPGKF